MERPFLMDRGNFRLRLGSLASAGCWMRRARPAAKRSQSQTRGNGYADAATLKEILAKLETIASYADLKTIRLQVQRRERELAAGVVQGTDGANVLVKM